MNNVEFTFYVRISDPTQRWAIVDDISSTPEFREVTHELELHGSGIRWSGEAEGLDRIITASQLDRLFGPKTVWIRGDDNQQAGVRSWFTSTNASIHDSAFDLLRPADFGKRPAAADPLGQTMTIER